MTFTLRVYYEDDSLRYYGKERSKLGKHYGEVSQMLQLGS